MGYDENLQENPFFQRLCILFPGLYEDATFHQWVICVPRIGTLVVEKCTENDFQCHILQPLNPLQPNSEFCTLNGKQVTLTDQVHIRCEYEDTKCEENYVNILFEETFYQKNDTKFRVVCLERPLQGECCLSNISSLQTVSDCVLFLKQEICDANILYEIELTIKNFDTDIWDQYINVKQLKDDIKSLYDQLLKIIFQSTTVMKKCESEESYKENIYLSVESYTIHTLEKKLYGTIKNLCARKDQDLNRLLRKFSYVEAKDLELKPHLIEVIPRCKHELAKIINFNTPFTKKLCLKRAFEKIELRNLPQRSLVSTDDILPFFIFLILKTSIFNWYAQLVFIKVLGISLNGSNEIWEYDFYVATLEAAVEHVCNGGLTNLTQSKWANYENELELGINIEPCNGLKPTSEDWENAKTLFKLVKRGVVYDLEEFAHSLNSNETVGNLCHPLCNCEKCHRKTKRLISFNNLITAFHDHNGRSVFHVAVSFGFDEVVEFLLQRNPKCVNVVDALNGSSPSHLASSLGSQTTLMLLLHYGCNVLLKDNEGNSYLHYAALNGHKQCVQALLYWNGGEKVDINAVNNAGDTPLHLASKLGFSDIVQLLLEFGADVDVLNKSKQKAVHVAHNDYVKRQLLLNYQLTRTDSSSKNAYSPPKIQHSSTDSQESAAINQNQLMIEKLLVAAANNDVNQVCNYLGLSYELMNHLIKEEEVEEGGGCSDNGAAVKCQTESDKMCHPLCQCESCQKVQNLKSPSMAPSSSTWSLVNSCNNNGTTLLHVISAHGHLELLRLTLLAGGTAAVNARDTNGMTPLLMAALNDRLKVAETLLLNGASVNMGDSGGNTPLHHAATSGSSPIVTLLIENGALVNCKNYNGETPLHLAKDVSVVKLLLDNKADFRSTDRRGTTPLHLAQGNDTILSLMTSSE